MICKGVCFDVLWQDVCLVVVIVVAVVVLAFGDEFVPCLANVCGTTDVVVLALKQRRGIDHVLRVRSDCVPCSRLDLREAHGLLACASANGNRVGRRLAGAWTDAFQE